MISIFDYNRTIYDPETDALAPGASEILSMLKEKDVSLHLISKREPGRERRIEELGIADLFDSIAFVDAKEEHMRRIIEIESAPVYVVGDHMHNEIRIGNRLGARTIHVKRGKFSGLLPETEYDVPWRTIKHLSELHDILLD